MSYTGKKYQCITTSIPFLYNEEIVEVIEFDALLDCVKLKRDRDGITIFITTDKFYNGFIFYDSSLLYNKSPATTLNKKCDCGISKTYGINSQGFMHYTDCPSYMNDKYNI